MHDVSDVMPNRLCICISRGRDDISKGSGLPGNGCWRYNPLLMTLLTSDYAYRSVMTSDSYLKVGHDVTIHFLAILTSPVQAVASLDLEVHLHSNWMLQLTLPDSCQNPNKQKSSCDCQTEHKMIMKVETLCAKVYRLYFKRRQRKIFTHCDKGSLYCNKFQNPWPVIQWLEYLIHEVQLLVASFCFEHLEWGLACFHAQVSLIGPISVKQIQCTTWQSFRGRSLIITRGGR